MADPDDQFSDALLLVGDRNRILAVRPSLKYPALLLAYSDASGKFSFAEAIAHIGFQDGKDQLVLLFADDAALERLKTLIGEARFFTVATKAPDHLKAVIKEHMAASGVRYDWSVATPQKELSPSMLRLLDRVGPDGFRLIGAPLVFGCSRAAYRIAVKTYAFHQQLENSTDLRDSLVRELAAWNLLSQTHVAIENFCALFAAVKAAQKDPKAFAPTFLRFGRAEGDLSGPSVMQVMDSILGKNAPDIFAEMFQIPVNQKDLGRVGLEDCGIEPTLLVDCGLLSLRIMMLHFRRLASVTIAQRDPKSGAPIKSIPLKAYGAFRHGFAAGFPLHGTTPRIISDDPRKYTSEEHFLEYWARAESMAEIFYLGDKDPSGKREVEYVTPPIFSRELKQFVRIIYLATKFTVELAMYARSLLSSRDLRFPYLVNSSLVLGNEGRAVLQKRLDELESRDA